MTNIEWNSDTLNNLLHLIIDYRGKTPKKLGGEWADYGIPAISAKNIKSGMIVNEEAIKYIDGNLYIKWMKHELDKDDIILTSEAPLGETYYLKRKQKLCLSQRLFALRANKEAIYPRYLYYYLQSKGGQYELLSRATGATAQGIRQSLLEEVKVIYPDYAIQQKIAAILSAYDDLVENNNRRIKILEEMVQLIYREWFVDFRFPGHENVKIVDSPLGQIPEGWELKMLGDIAEEIRRSVSPSDIEPTTPYFGLEHLPRKSIALSQWGIASEVKSTKLAFQKGEILFGKIRPYFHKVGVAPLEGVCSSDTIVIRPKRPAYFGLLLACVSSERFVNHASQTSQGTKMPRANWDVLVKYMIPAPQGELLSQFNRYMNQTVDLIHNMILRNRNLRQTRDLLLPKLISGGLDVSGLDIDIGEDAA